MNEQICPACDKPMRKRMMLYGVMVCHRCVSDFEFRRSAAFVIDYMLLLTIAAIVLAILPIFESTPMTNDEMPGFMTGVLIALLGDVVKLGVVIGLLMGLPNVGDDWIEGMVLAGRCVVFPLVFALRDGFYGRSPGKWLCGLVTVDQKSNEPIGFTQSFKRNIPLAIPFAWLYVLLTLRNGLRLGDQWAGTMVVLKTKRHLPIFAGTLFCHHCQYNLRGNTSGQCPECGTMVSASSKVH